MSEPHTWSGSTPVVTHCTHGVDLRLTPRCYLCEPEARATPDPEMDYEMRDRMLAIAFGNPARNLALWRVHEAARDPYSLAVGEHGHDEAHSADWPSCLPAHIAMNRYRAALADLDANVTELT